MSKKRPVEGPFSKLEAIVKNAGIRLDGRDVAAGRSKQANQPAEPVPLDEDDLFRHEMAGVAKLTWQPGTLSRGIREVPPLVRDSAAEDLRLMQGAIDGDQEGDVLDHPEYIEGWVGVTGRRLLPNLRAGLYSIQGQIDLHGLGREEARLVVEDFIGRMSRFRSCCVKIIHGRGINSPNDRAILKESLQRWLSTRRLSRHVLAYASAPIKDGGVGAIYVLLRSRP